MFAKPGAPHSKGFRYEASPAFPPGLFRGGLHVEVMFRLNSPFLRIEYIKKEEDVSRKKLLGSLRKRKLGTLKFDIDLIFGF